MNTRMMFVRAVVERFLDRINRIVGAKSRPARLSWNGF
jgi:hypothetical protein